MTSQVLMTFDVDWSPDWIIDEVSEIMIRGGVRSTWFVTHASPAIDRLRSRPDLFELGIHPNCLPGSTHGANERQVLRHIKEIVPEAVSMRSHGLYQTSAFLILAAREFGIRLESNILLPGAPGLVHSDLRIDEIVVRRVPFYWSDDLAMRDPQDTWKEASSVESSAGLKVFAFHPFHVVMNASDYRLYERLKLERPLPDWTPDFIAPYRSRGKGAGTVLQTQVAALTGRPTAFLKDLLSTEATAG
jgi:hypothetical protein